jgi:hypothetical protein
MRRLRLSALLCACALAVALGVKGLESAPGQSPGGSSTGFEQVEQGLLDAGSVSLGTPQRGALVRGVELPPDGTDFFTWDFPLK